MTNLTKASDAGLVRGEFLVPQSRRAGVEIAAGDALYIDSNGILQLADADELEYNITGSVRMPKFAGLAPRNIPSGTVGEVYGRGAEFRIVASGLTVGNPIWLDDDGQLADTPKNAGDIPVATAVSATNIVLKAGV